MGDNDNRVAITFWGVRGSTPCANRQNMEYGGNTTCVQIDVPGCDEILILDSGTGIRNLGNELAKREEGLQGRIFITHPHWDHIQGFPFFKPIYGSRNRFEIHMPAQEDGGCKDILAGHLTRTFFPVTLQMIDANLKYVTQPAEKVEYDGYSVEFMLANHTANTAIYKIRVGEKTIIFCPDNELDPRNIEKGTDFCTRMQEFCMNADLFIHDGQYDLDAYKRRKGWGHSAWQVVVYFARRAKVKNLYLTHHDPDSDDRYLRKLDKTLCENFNGQFETIQLAREGVTIHL